jgi:hypothetical protein
VSGACAKIQTAIDNKGENAEELRTELESIKAEAPPAVQAAITLAVAKISAAASPSASEVRASASAQVAAAAGEVLSFLEPVCSAAGVTLSTASASAPESAGQSSEQASESASPSS